MTDLGGQQKLAEQYTREVHWAITSTPLFTHGASDFGRTFPSSKFYLDLWGECYPHLAHIPIKTWITDLATDRNLLVGKRFEQLVEFWFQHNPHFELLATNHQLICKEITEGEIDVLATHHDSGITYHFELACKLFLSSDNSSNWQSWIGPNGRDTLAEKMNKLEEQSTRLYSAAGKSFLNSLGLDAITPVCWVKGYFFHHISTMSAPKAPLMANSGYPSGYWMQLVEAKAFFSGQRLWAILERKHWIGPYASSDQVDLIPEKELFEVLDNPMLLACMSQTDNGWHEEHRGFVVGDGWPRVH
jgi:uncharacterized protein